jgi:hypothetical protein
LDTVKGRIVEKEFVPIIKQVEKMDSGETGGTTFSKSTDPSKTKTESSGSSAEVTIKH